jgi:alkylation response protein AidB-like acyl-CoA dehydrogenase
VPYAPDTYHLTPEQVTLKRETHRFAEEVLRPASMELDALSPEEVIAPGSRLRDVFKAAYQAEYHLRGFPEQLGGASLGPGDQQVITEEMGWGSGGLAISLSVGAMPFRFAAMTGHPDLMRDVVTPFVEDREGKYIGCWAGTGARPYHAGEGGRRETAPHPDLPVDPLPHAGEGGRGGGMRGGAQGVTCEPWPGVRGDAAQGGV